MKHKWFKKYGWVYLPVSVTGFAITLLILSVFVHDFIFIDSRAHSVSDTYYNFLPYGGIYFFAYMWIASNTSGKE